MTAPSTPAPVLHEPERHRFVLDVSNGQGILAYIEYAVVQQGQEVALDLYHTYVPPEGRGQGAAGELSKAAFEYAKLENMAVIPSCSYVSVSPQHELKARLEREAKLCFIADKITMIGTQ